MGSRRWNKIMLLNKYIYHELPPPKRCVWMVPLQSPALSHDVVFVRGVSWVRRYFWYIWMHACRWVLIVIARLFYVRMILPSSFLIHVQILNQRNLARNLESCLNWLFDTKLALHDGENSVRYLVLKENQVKLMIFPFSVKSMFLNLLNKYILICILMLSVWWEYCIYHYSI